MIDRSQPLGLILVLLLGAAGCVTLRPAARVPSSRALALEGVPLTEFGTQDCGAASLSAVLAYWGEEVSIDALDRELPKAANGGVLSLDMLLAARERGFQAELVRGDRQTIAENLEAGRPLILMLRVLDAVGRRRDLYHYVIVDGFDPAADLVRVQYGDGSARWVSLDRLARAWDDTDYATLVLQPAGEPTGAGASIRYAVALEEDDRLEEAAEVYRHLLEEAPETALAWVNLGNVEAALAHTDRAEEAYRRALELVPEDADALNNLAWLLLEADGDLDEARRLAERAVAAAGHDPYLALDTLGRVELARGRCEAAADAFRSALETAPGGSAARDRILDGLEQSERDCGSEDRTESDDRDRSEHR